MIALFLTWFLTFFGATLGFAVAASIGGILFVAMFSIINTILDDK